MPGAAIGGLLGFVLSGTGLGIGLAGFLGVSAGTLWMIGASIGSLFDAPDIDLGSSTPNYSFGQLSNTKSQLLPIPIVYGRCRVGGNVFMQKFYDDSLQKMDMFVGVSEGPVQSITSIYASDMDLTDENGDITHELDEVTLNVHLGETGQLADSRDPSGSTYPNVAYIGLTLKAQDNLSGNPIISSIVEGRKVWTPSGTVFSRNPAWIVYDFLTDTRYGVGIPSNLIDLDSFTAAATYCDQLVEGEPRFTLDYIIDQQKPAIDHLQAMMACFRGYFLARDKIELHIEQAGSVYKTLDPDNFVKGSFSWWQKSGDDSPNRITLEWINPNNHYEQSSAFFEITEDIAARGVYEKSFSVLGVTRSSQVGRLGNYLIETARRVQNFCSFQVSTKDADIEAGEIIAITYPDFTAWNEKKFRVLAVQDDGESGNVTITCAEYDSAVYGDTALPVQTPIVDPTPVTHDDVYALALEDVGYIAEDGTWFPLIRAIWQNPSDYTPAALNVRWRYAGDTEWNMFLNTSRLTTQATITGLTTGEEVEVWVNCVKPNNGGETTGDTATLSVGKDVTPPGECTGLAATGWFGSIILEWTNPADKDLNYVELWENAVDSRASAVKIADVKGAGFTRYLGSFQGRYYWVRGVDLSGNIGPWNAEAGVYGNSDQENHQDFVDLLLEDNPYLNEAIGDINTRIDPIETNLDNFLDVTLPEIVNVTLPNITDRLETVEVDLPGAVQRLAERMKEIDADVMDQLRSVSSSAVDALLNIAEIGQRITDAGIKVDPDTGEVRIWAVDQLRTEHGVRLSNAEQLISAQAGIISQKVGIADVDARIAEAVFGNVGELLVSGLEAHITSVEQELNAAKAELTQKANSIEVDEIGGRVGTAETKISGLEASVALKATQEEVDELTSRVTTAEFTVDAINGTIGSEIVAIGQEGRDLANLTAEGLVEAILNDSENHDRAKIQLATAKTEIYARVEEGLSAEAGQRTALAAVVDGNYSTYLESTALITNELRAEVTKREQLQSTVEGIDADVIELSGAVAGKADVIYSATPPEDAKNNDLWCATADSGTYKQGSFYRLVNEVWTKITDPILLQTLDPDFEGSLAWKADQIEAAANSKNRTFRQYTAPTTGMSTGDLWFDSDDNNKAYRYNGSSWIQTDDLRIAANTASINTEATTRADADSAEAKRVNVLFSGSEGDPLADPPSPTSVRGRLQTSEETIATHTSSLARYGRQLTASINSNVTESVSAPGSPTPGMVWKCTATSGAYAGKFWVWDRTSESNPYGWIEIKGISGDLYGSVNSITASVTDLSGTIAGKSDVIYAASPPAGAKSNDIWCATASSGSYEAGSFYRLSGGTWTKITDPFLVRALDENFEGSLAYDLKQLDANVGDLSSTIDEIAEVSATESTATGSFTRNMVAQLGNQVGSGLVEDILNQADARKNAVQQYAMIQQDYNVKIEDGLLSEATAREELAAKVGANEAAILSEAVTRSTQDASLASQITTLQSTVGANTSAIQTEATTRADADTAIASQITTLAASTFNGTVTESASAPGNPTLGQVYYNTTSKKYFRWDGTAWVEVKGLAGSNNAAIQTEATARTDADSALSTTISTVSAVANAKNKTYRQASAPTTGMSEGDLWFDSDDNNKAYRYNGSSWVATDDARIAQNTADIQTEATARADGDSAVASQVTTLQTTTVGGTVTESASAPSSPTAGQVYYNTTSKKYFRYSGTAWVEVKGVEGHSRSAIQIINESVDGIKGKHAVKIDTNGYVTGYELIGTGTTSSMVFHVDNFLVGKPGTTDNYPFVIGTVDGVSRVSMDSAFIQDASIKAAKIKNLEVDRIKLKNGGEISAINSTYATSQLSKNTGIHDLLSVAVQHDANATARTIVIASVSVQNHLAQVQAWITQNGVDKACLIDTGWADEGDIWSHTLAWTDTTNTGALCTYGLRVKVINGGSCTIRPRSLSVIHIYK